MLLFVSKSKLSLTGFLVVDVHLEGVARVDDVGAAGDGVVDLEGLQQGVKLSLAGLDVDGTLPLAVGDRVHDAPLGDAVVQVEVIVQLLLHAVLIHLSGGHFRFLD